MEKEGMCCICGGEYTHFGNNPRPVVNCEGRCCDACNWEVVIPARIRRSMAR